MDEESLKLHVSRDVTVGFCVVSGRTALIAAGVLFAAVLPTVPAYAISCPVAHRTTTRDALRETQSDIREFSNLFASQGAAAIPYVVGQLTRRFPKATHAEITDFLLAAYCPAVNGNSNLNEAAKRSRMLEFSSQITRELVKR
jgi:hypothetical protein